MIALTIGICIKVELQASCRLSANVTYVGAFVVIGMLTVLSVFNTAINALKRLKTVAIGACMLFIGSIDSTTLSRAYMMRNNPDLRNVYVVKDDILSTPLPMKIYK